MSTPPATDAVITTPLTELLQIRHPILLAPMGGTAGGRLAAAVSDAGALGLIGGGYADPRWLTAELEAADGARVGVGFITFALDDRREALQLALDADPVAIQLSFGDPRPFADDIHQSGALLICQIQSPDELSYAMAAGADVVIAQGQDAGGHGRPDRGTIALVPSVVDEADPLPVVAAGGLADGRGLAAALMLGAAGITLGTRFLASIEATSNPMEAAALVAARSADTVRTTCSTEYGGQRGRRVTTGGRFATNWWNDGTTTPTRLPSRACFGHRPPTTTRSGRCGRGRDWTSSPASRRRRRSSTTSSPVPSAASEHPKAC